MREGNKSFIKKIVHHQCLLKTLRRKLDEKRGHFLGKLKLI